MKIVNCQFCQLDSKYIIAENSHCSALYFPKIVKKGHIVLTVKDHVPTFDKLTNEHVSHLFQLAHEISQHAINNLGIEKYYIAAIGDSGDHFHLHMLPKASEEEGLGKYIFSNEGWCGRVGMQQTEEELNEFIKKYKENILNR